MTPRQTCSCGNPLSQYNRTGRCNTCRTSPPAPVIPPNIWEDPRLIAALADGDLGQLSKQFRAAAGMNQIDFGKLTGLPQSYVSMLESGRRRLSPGKAQEVLARMAAPTHLDGAVPSAPDVFQQTATGHSHHGGLTELAAQAAAQSLQFADEQLAASGLQYGTADRLRNTIAGIATDYVHAPIESVFLRLLPTRDELFGHLRGLQKPDDTKELLFLAGTTCLLMAHASQNLGDESSAHAQIKTAWTLADRANHNGLKAWTRGTAALIAEWSAHPHSAVTHTKGALEYAPTGESRIRIAAIQARAAARTGNRELALRSLKSLNLAREQQPETGHQLEQFGGLLTFPSAKQDYYIGSTYALLGDHKQAEKHARTAVTAYETGPAHERSYGDLALARLDIATSRIARNELDGAAEEIKRILEMPHELRIRQLGTAIGNVAALLSHPRFQGNRTANELTDAALEYHAIDTTAKAPLP
ncbi:helix-turn-helix domain-containing protein [Streptomyces sp. NPDC015350]|uniref:helix-turn-helix domain-containing protein n=1 Tax=Streptomyces sp. NPDC015350 TaxID=3364955 RepID=UPI0037001089